MSQHSPKPFKCILIGTGATGKTTLLTSHFEITLPLYNEYIPTPSPKKYTFTNQDRIEIEVWDTPVHGEAFDKKRIETYPAANLVMICFSIAAPSSLEHVSSQWISEARLHAPQAAILLLGLKSDLRDDVGVYEALREKGLRPVSWEEGERVAREIGAKGYLECSAQTGEGAVRVFERIAELAREEASST